VFRKAKIALRCSLPVALVAWTGESVNIAGRAGPSPVGLAVAFLSSAVAGYALLWLVIFTAAREALRVYRSAASGP
jgi:hypothetical protein